MFYAAFEWMTTVTAPVCIFLLAYADSFLLVVEAKYEWPAKSVAQTLVEAGCLLKKRLAAGKNTPVFAVLTNGLLFRFFAIDTDGTVYSSGLPPIG